jgi:hypothetical protein
MLLLEQRSLKIISDGQHAIFTHELQICTEIYGGIFFPENVNKIQDKFECEGGIKVGLLHNTY